MHSCRCGHLNCMLGSLIIGVLTPRLTAAAAVIHRTTSKSSEGINVASSVEVLTRTPLHQKSSHGVMRSEARTMVQVSPALSSRLDTSANTPTEERRATPLNCSPFDHVFFINLEGSAGQERRAAMHDEFAREGIVNAEVAPAVNFKDNVTNFSRLLDEGENIRITDGHERISVAEAALSLSHRAIYERMLKERIQCAMIFEDDVILATDFVKRFNSVRLPAEYDWVKIDYGGACKGNATCSETEGTPELLPEVSEAMASSAYVLSKRGAELLIAGNTPLWMNADGNLDPEHLKFTAAAKFFPLKTFRFFPKLAWQGREGMHGGIRGQF